MPVTINGSSGLTTNDGSVFTDASGNVGIGTGSPIQKLDVSGSGDTRIKISSTDANPAALQLTTTHPSPNNNNWIIDVGSGGTRNFRITDALNAERMRIDTNGNVGIGTSSPGTKLSVAGTFFTTSTVQVPFIGSATGTAVVIDGSGFLRANTSSRRYKENIEAIDVGLAEVLQMQPVKYDLKATGEAQVGFIAEDFPEQRLVNHSLVDPLDPEKGEQVESVNYSNLTAILVKAIQEQQAIIESLTARVVALEGQA